MKKNLPRKWAHRIENVSISEVFETWNKKYSANTKAPKTGAVRKECHQWENSNEKLLCWWHFLVFHLQHFVCAACGCVCALCIVFLCYPRKCIAKRIFLGNKWKLFTLHRIFSLCHLMWCSAAQSSVRHKARDEEKMNRKVIHKNSLQQWVHIAQCSVYI